MGWQSVSGEEGHMGDCKETIVEQIGAEEDGGFVLADEHTLGGFIDPHDVGQVKYEMVRAVALGELTTVEAARRFGYSRETVYNCMRALKRDGMWGLLPKKRGPLYKLFRGIGICIAAIFRGILFLLKLIVPNMVLVERLLVLGGLGIGAYSIIWPPLNWWYVGGGIFMLVLAIVAHAYNDEVRREA